MAVEIIHWNLRGIKTRNNQNYKKKVEIVNDYLENPQNTMLLNLQETHLRCEGEIPQKWKDFGHLYSIISTFAHDDDTYAGITVFVNKTFEIISTEVLIEGRVLLITAKNKNSSEIFYFISVYGKASGDFASRKHILNKIHDRVKSDKIEENVFCFGDYNFVCSTLDRNTNVLSRNDELIKPFWEEFENFTNIIDCFRLTHKTKRLYTYSSSTNAKSRIDRLFAPISWAGKVSNSVFENTGVSDHKILKTRFKQSVQKGPGHYVVNNLLLTDGNFRDQVRNLINEYHDNASIYPNYITMWDFVKTAISGHSQNFSIEQSRERKIEYFNAKANIDLIESIPKENLTPSLLTDLEHYKQIEMKYWNFKRSGTLLRAKIANFEENEAQISYLSKIEKLKGESNTITSLIDENGEIKEGTKNVLNVVYKYFSNLYKREKEDVLEQNYFLRNINKRLSNEDKEMLDQPFTLDELSKSLKDLKPNKSPGEDSLTKEFYECFWNEISPIYKKCLDEIEETENLCNSQKRGLITLVYKKNGREFLGNYRPVSSQNLDVKILTRTLAKRLAAVINKLIDQNQTCLPGRKMNKNIHILQDLIDYINKNNYQALVLFFDNEKAFDRISHRFLIKTLRHFGFGDRFIKWIKIIYKESVASVKVNGFSTEYFPIERGLRQGCPLSSLLYVLCAEVLALEIRSNQGIVGVKYKNKEHKDSSYADDFQIVVTKLESIDITFDILSRFGKATNSKINLDKSEALWVGNWKNNVMKPGNLRYTNKMVKSVGVFVGNEREEAEKRGFEEIKEKIKNKIKFWKGKGISLKGRVKVANIFITSKLWNTCEVQDITNKTKQEIYKLLLDFVWGGNYHQRSKLGIQEDYNEGGLRLGNIENKIKTYRVKWLLHLCESDQNSIERFLANALISDGKLNLGLNILKGYTIDCTKSVPNKFYRNACAAWINSKIRFKPKNQQSIGNLWIYNNILLKDDDGRVYKPPSARKKHCMPKTFNDLPFPIINRCREDSTLIRSINTAYDRINWSIEDCYILKMDTIEVLINKISFKELYWASFKIDQIYQPWKLIWEQMFPNDTLHWEQIWENVHNKMCTYRVQSSLWMIVNMNFISSYKLNKMFNSLNICRQCDNPEEGPVHTILHCAVSDLVFGYFENILLQIVPLNISIQERAFGLMIQGQNTEKQKKLRNYLLFCVKHIIFKRRAKESNFSLEVKSRMIIDECKRFIITDLQSKFFVAKNKNEIVYFQNTYLIDNIIDHLTQTNN